MDGSVLRLGFVTNKHLTGRIAVTVVFSLELGSSKNEEVTSF